MTVVQGPTTNAVEASTTVVCTQLLEVAVGLSHSTSSGRQVWEEKQCQKLLPNHVVSAHRNLMHLSEHALSPPSSPNMCGTQRICYMQCLMRKCMHMPAKI